MERRFELPRDLLGNTLSMQDATTRWLPAEDEEKPNTYKNRLRRTVLFNPFGQTIDQAAARPFRNPVTIADEEAMDGDVLGFQDDVDLEGRSLTQFARDLTADAMAYGLGMYLVEWSAVRERAFWKQLEPGSLYHWRKDPETMAITEVRFRLMDVREDEDSGELKEQGIVWRYFAEEGGVFWERYAVSDVGTGSAVLEDEGQLLGRNGAPIEEIPLVVVYANRKDSLVAFPPYERLADLNWRHWQAYSDLSHLLRFVTIPILARFGQRRTGSEASDVDGSVESPMTVSASSVVDLGPKDHADLKYVEIQGKAVESAMSDLSSIEEKMQTEGSTPVMRVSAQTATQTMVDELSREAGMTAFVRALEVALTLGMQKVFEWESVEAPADLMVQVNEDRPLTAGREKRADLVMRARKERVITNQTAIVELKRDQILSEEVEPEAETARVMREANDLVDQMATLPDRDDEFAAGVFDGDGDEEGDGEA